MQVQPGAGGELSIKACRRRRRGSCSYSCFRRFVTPRLERGLVRRPLQDPETLHRRKALVQLSRSRRHFYQRQSESTEQRHKGGHIVRSWGNISRTDNISDRTCSHHSIVRVYNSLAQDLTVLVGWLVYFLMEPIMMAPLCLSVCWEFSTADPKMLINGGNHI